MNRTNKLTMAALPLNLSLDSEANTIEDLTADEVGDTGLWIGQQKQYRNVPNFVTVVCYLKIK